jgi:AcrR family transcriptional regulator
VSAAVRERCKEAMLELVISRGYEATTTEEVCELAGVSRAEFDRHFASKEECAIAVFDHFQADFETKVMAAYGSEEAWPDNLRAAAYAIAEWSAANPRGMRFGTVEMLWISEAAQARRLHGFETFLGMIEAGREVAPDPEAVPPHTAGRLMGSVAEILTRRMQGKGFDARAFVPELMSLIVSAYLGEEAGARELRVPPPPRAEAD